MLRKYILIVSVFAVLCVPLPAKAQTTLSAAQLVQNVMDKFSEIRSTLKQIESSANIESMMQNLGGSGDWKAALKNVTGGIFDKNADKAGTKESLIIVPDGLDSKIDDPEAAKEWMKENLYVKSDATFEEIAKVKEDANIFLYTSTSTAYGKAVSVRKKMDKEINTIEKLRQDAEGKESETDLQNEINKITLLKLEQAAYTQMLITTGEQITGLAKIMNR